MQWIFPSVIAALVTLVAAFGVLYLNRRNARHDKSEDERSKVSAATLSSEATLLGLLLDRIEKLESRLDENAQRSQERQSRIEHLENARDECKQELIALMDSHLKLKEQFEQQLGRTKLDS